MAKLLGSVAMTAVLLLAGAAFACPAEKSADASSLPVVTASKQSLPATDVTPTGQTTKAKTTDTGTGG
jgi:hypothetical protein